MSYVPTYIRTYVDTNYKIRGKDVRHKKKENKPTINNKQNKSVDQQENKTSIRRTVLIALSSSLPFRDKTIVDIYRNDIKNQKPKTKNQKQQTKTPIMKRIAVRPCDSNENDINKKKRYNNDNANNNDNQNKDKDKKIHSENYFVTTTTTTTTANNSDSDDEEKEEETESQEDSQCCLIYQGGKITEKDRQRIVHVKISSHVHELIDHTFDGCQNLEHVEFLTSSSSSVTTNTTTTSPSLSESQQESVKKSESGSSSSSGSESSSSALKRIGSYAFAQCESLKCIIIPTSVSTIESSAFYGCSSLTNITLPPSLQNMKEKTFAYSYALASIQIPHNCMTIGNDTFYECSSLLSIDFSKSSSLEIIGEKVSFFFHPKLF